MYLNTIGSKVNKTTKNKQANKQDSLSFGFPISKIIIITACMVVVRFKWEKKKDLNEAESKLQGKIAET